MAAETVGQCRANFINSSIQLYRDPKKKLGKNGSKTWKMSLNVDILGQNGNAFGFIHE
jgi:hypothetical protein